MTLLIIYYLIVILYFTLLFGAMFTFITMRYNPFNDEDIHRWHEARRNARRLTEIYSIRVIPRKEIFNVDHYINYSDTLADLYRLENVNVGDIIFIKNMQAYYMYTNDLKYVKLDAPQKDVTIVNTYLLSTIGAFITIETKIALGVMPEKETVKNIYFI